MRPTILHVGGVLYWTMQTRNPDTMILKDADSTPTVAVRKNGASTADSVTVTKRSATTGLYDCSYDPASEVEGDEFVFEESATVTGTTTAQATYLFGWSCTVIAVNSGSNGVVNVLPATGIVADRSAGATLNPVVGETISQSITVYQSDGTTAVDLSGKSLKIIFETMSGTDVAVVAAADITVSGTDDNIVTFAYPSAVTATERSLRFAIRDAAAPLTMYLQGVCSVTAAPKVDV